MLIACLPASVRGQGQGQGAAQDREAYRQIFSRIDIGEDLDARLLAEKLQDPLIVKYARWSSFTRGVIPPAFADIQSFIKENPSWPAQSALRRQAELPLSQEADNATTIDWFKDREPVTREGRLRLAEALRAVGRTAEADNWVRKAWIEDLFTPADEDSFIERYHQSLRPVDQITKLDKQLWRGQSDAARRQMKRVDPETRALATARLTVQAGKGGIDKALAAVPAKLAADPGLLFDRIRWNRQKGNRQAARDLMLRVPSSVARPDLWWDERNLLIRDAIEDNAASAAYKIASEHRLSPSHDSYVQAEFLAGWIALRLSKQPSVAARHFEAIYAGATIPISKARGAYWSGLAYEALKQDPVATNWFIKAADHLTTFYGQLAAAKLSMPQLITLPAQPTPSKEAAETFEAMELVKLIRHFAEIGFPERADMFVLRLSDLSPGPEGAALVSALAQSINRQDLAVQVARRVTRDGVVLIDSGYPILPIDQGAPAEPALVHAVIRQESSFYTSAASKVGAQGLMQLMPSTAKAVANRLKLPFAPAKLQDGSYNMQLGQAYLGEILNAFGGSYVLSIAAYNAGPSRVRQWLKDIGDPRDGKIETIDWIERVPFGETRNYIQRVLEGLQIYRLLLAGKSQPAAPFGSFTLASPAASASWCLLACTAWATPASLGPPPDDSVN